ncbi:Variable major protein (plasmid) [Borrelia crocidurae DOU]|uniref:Variable large protein n=1 Tax=Borrelia crocidurae DOU TaxID=1293575 RepID=W5SQY8_9SPIR|nr:variable large family protein [Borrelia crocidurae]AHH07481.1 Variable major protein [Borrelia crocidurae DOU]
MKKPLGLLIIINLFIGCDSNSMLNVSKLIDKHKDTGSNVFGLDKLSDESKDALLDSALTLGQEVLQVGKEIVPKVVDMGEEVVSGTLELGQEMLQMTQNLGEVIVPGAVQAGQVILPGALKAGQVILSEVFETGKTVVPGVLETGKVIGRGLQDIFWFVGNVVGDVLEDLLVKADIKSTDKRSKVKEHFDKVKSQLEATKNKVDGSSSTSSGVLTKLIDAVKKLAEAAGDDKTDIGAISESETKASIVSDKESIQSIIEGIKEIVNIAQESGVNVLTGDAGATVTASAQIDAPAALNSGKGGAQEGAGAKLAEEISKADPWAMIDKIKNSKIKSGDLDGNNSDAGELVTGFVNTPNGIGAKTNADFAAAVALKAMSKSGKFAVKDNNSNSDDANKIKAAAAEAVNKVLDTLGLIIRSTVKMEIGKVNKKVIK